MRDRLEPRTYLVIEAHADDAALWCGGLMLRWASEGHRVVLVRVTDDRNDSVGLSCAETKAVNRQQLHQAAEMLGVAEVVDLDFEDAMLTDLARVPLRERLIHLYRIHRPWATCTFDPYSTLFENNQDHLAVAKAADEAFWMAMCDKHVPEDLGAGLDLHGVYERWYFGRRLPEVTTWIDIGPFIERKIEAASAHQAMMQDTALQLTLQAETAGLAVPIVDAASGGDVRPFVDFVIRSDAREAGARHGCEYAEEYRVIRFAAVSGSLRDLLPPDRRDSGSAR